MSSSSGDIAERFAQQYEQHSDMLLGLARNLSCGRVSDVEEVFHKSVLAVYEKTVIGEYEPANFKRITAQTIKNNITEELRANGIRGRFIARHRLPDTIAQSPSAQRIVEVQESNKTIEQAIAKVLSYINTSKRKKPAQKELDRRVLALLLVEERPYEAGARLAEEMGVTRGVICQRLVRLRSELARALGELPSWRAI